MGHRGHGCCPFGACIRLVTLAAGHWLEVSGHYKSGTGKNLAEEDIGSFCAVVYSYFVNTNEFRHSSRKDMLTYAFPDVIQLNEKGEDDRPIDKQMESMQDEWAAFTQQVTKPNEESIQEVDPLVD